MKSGAPKVAFAFDGKEEEEDVAEVIDTSAKKSPKKRRKNRVQRNDSGDNDLGVEDYEDDQA